MNAPSSSAAPGALFAKIGVAMQVAVLLGISVTTWSVAQSFQELRAQAESVVDPSHVSAAVGDALGWTLAGIVVAFLGHILMAVAVGISRYRARWFFWAIIVSAPLLIPSFPLGTFVLVYALVKWEEFLKPA